jgi:peptidoglycan/xylan/chitin deacetylase (PgdA/CDA1 family)
MKPSRMSERLAFAWQRRAARWFVRRTFTLLPGPAIVSFTFDDFPRSALHTGGAILERVGVAGTYYTSLGLAGRTTASGQMFVLADLPDLLARGHELGCHTFDHLPAGSTAPAAFEASVRRNQQALDQELPGAVFRSLSYPISNPRPETKRRMERPFVLCRGGGQVFNHGTIDLNYVSAFFLEQSVDDPGAVRRIIDANQAAGGWLVFATHDIGPTPTRFGCTPPFFQQAVDAAAASGAKVLPVGQAWDVLRQRGHG